MVNRQDGQLKYNGNRQDRQLKYNG